MILNICNLLLSSFCLGSVLENTYYFDYDLKFPDYRNHTHRKDYFSYNASLGACPEHPIEDAIFVTVSQPYLDIDAKACMILKSGKLELVENSESMTISEPAELPSRFEYLKSLNLMRSAGGSSYLDQVIKQVLHETNGVIKLDTPLSLLKANSSSEEIYFNYFANVGREIIFEFRNESGAVGETVRLLVDGTDLSYPPGKGTVIRTPGVGFYEFKFAIVPTGKHFEDAYDSGSVTVQLKN